MRNLIFWLNGLSLGLAVLVAVYLFFFVPSVRTLYVRPDFIFPKIDAINDIEKSKELSKEIVDRFKGLQRQSQLVLVSVFAVNALFVGVFALNVLLVRKSMNGVSQQSLTKSSEIVD